MTDLQETSERVTCDGKPTPLQDQEHQRGHSRHDADDDAVFVWQVLQGEVSS